MSERGGTMTRGIKIDVGAGWSAIALNLIVVGSRYPEQWNFRFHRAWRNCGRMRIAATTDSDDPVAIEATVALAQLAWRRSGETCEICGRDAHLRLGKRYALTLCREHEHLIGERHPDDGRIRDPWARHVGKSPLTEGYDDPAAVRDELLQMWSRGEAAMSDVQELLQMSRAEVMTTAMEAGYRLHLDDDPDAEYEKGAEFARLIAAAADDGTRH
ncbi:hypothetical protein [Rhizobium sp. TRM95796]|uniref:hypothetical protein n=1 Tax=Rhizobium sp. TRM95796 TaxID=2979862 RepID=UPI0021E7B156|nr:hypothetical protein [Rhizobium sp. TRM95796]MCV3768894.1 hypothetical protein [Rhizobium sp. TRM95796]